MWCFERSAQIYSHYQTTDPWPCLPDELQPQRQSFWCTSISQQGANRVERGPLSDKNTKIYTHVVLSHKVKEIWSSCYDVGWGGVRELEKFSQSKRSKNTNWNVESTASCIEIIRSARLNIITGVDFVSQGSQTTADFSSRCRIYVDIFSLWEMWQLQIITHQSHGETFDLTKISKMSRLHERDATQTVTIALTVQYSVWLS